MGDDDWGVGYAKSLAVLLNGSAHLERDRHGHVVRDDSFYLALNAWEQPLDFHLPARTWGGPWQVVADTSDDRPIYRPELAEPGAECHSWGTISYCFRKRPRHEEAGA